MTVKRIDVVGEENVLTPDELIEALQKPGVVDYGIQVTKQGVLPIRIRKLILWIDPQVFLNIKKD